MGALTHDTGHYGNFNGQSVGYNDFQFRPQMAHNVPQLPSQTGYGGRYPQDLRNNSIAAQQPNGMYTRNLIGSLVSSAARLTDPQDKIGIWFVLQDLSVRTEGWFRYVFLCHPRKDVQLTGYAACDSHFAVSGCPTHQASRVQVTLKRSM